MPRQPYYSTPTRRIPITASSGTPIKLSTPQSLVGWNDNWSGLVLIIAAVTDTDTITITEATGIVANGCETGVLTTSDRLNGLRFKHHGGIYRITDHTSSAGTSTIDFTPATDGDGGAGAMTAGDVIKVQADLPMLTKSVLIKAGGQGLHYSFQYDTVSSGGLYTTLSANQSRLLSDDFAMKQDPIFVRSASASADTMEMEVFVP